MPYVPQEDAFAYDSEEVAGEFNEWCTAAGIEPGTDEEYKLARKAFTAGMNAAMRYELS